MIKVYCDLCGIELEEELGPTWVPYQDGPVKIEVSMRTIRGDLCGPCGNWCLQRAVDKAAGLNPSFLTPPPRLREE